MVQKEHRKQQRKTNASRRAFLHKSVAVTTAGVGFVGTADASPSTVQPDSHLTTITVSETEGETVHYIIDVTGNSLEGNPSKNENDNDGVTLHSNYATAEGYVKSKEDEYTFSGSDRISRVVLDSYGNCEINLSNGLDTGTEYDITVRAEEWGPQINDPACDYSFTSAGTVSKVSHIEDNNDEIDGGGDTASGYVVPPNKDVWRTTGQFTSIHGKPWQNSLIIEVGDLPRGST